MTSTEYKNIYHKYCPHVWLAKCSAQHDKGEIIIVHTRRGGEHACQVHNLIDSSQGFFYYSITRLDGYNMQERARQKAERHRAYAMDAEAKSEHYHGLSNKNREVLSLGEPIKQGHHSQGKHLRMLSQARANMQKSHEYYKKSQEYADRAEYWQERASQINLSIPESLPHFKQMLQEALLEREEMAQGQKSGRYGARDRGKIKELEKKVKLATKLWG